MTNEPNYKVMNDSLIDALVFSKKILEDELNVTVKSYEDMISKKTSLEASGKNVPNEIYEALEAKEKMIKSLEKDISFIKTEYLDEIDKLNNDPDDEVKNEKIMEIIEPFFTRYINNSVTPSYRDPANNGVEVHLGESLFKKIVSQSKKYAQLEDKINKLDEKLNKLMAKRDLKEHGKKEKKHHREEYLKKRIAWLNRRKASIKGKRSIILMNRKEKISKRNAKIALLEAKASFSKPQKQQKVKSRVDELKKKSIYLNSSNLLIFGAGFNEIIIRDEHKEWAKKAYSEYDKKVGRKL